MARKNKGKAASKTKATPKATQPPTTAKKAKTPPWLKSTPTDYIVGTEDYAALIEKHNELFDTHWLKWRVRPQVFYTIHERVWNHYHDKK